MKKIHKYLITGISIFVLALSITSVILWGPLFINLNSHEITSIIFKDNVDADDPSLQTVTVVTEAKINAITTELRTIYISKRIFKCNCAGQVIVTIQYEDDSFTEFDGYFLLKTDKDGKTKKYTTSHFATRINEIYTNYIES